jgi:2-polyprenyl-3-methyl-5-hydroxy-6-metoxy-1,4-benzoquinol methylase
MEKIMDRSFEVYEGKFMSAQAQYILRQRIEWICEQAHGVVLDIGCSQGLNCVLLAKRGHTIVGVDADKDAVAWARNNLLNYPALIQQRITLCAITFEEFQIDSHFDTVIAGEYLEHLDDVQLPQHLAKISSFLKQDARFVLTTPFGQHQHPDYKQIFFPYNMLKMLTPYFTIESMQVENGYIYCICCALERCGTSSNHLHEQQLFELYEKGVLQIQERLQQLKKIINISRKPAIQTDAIKEYLTHPEETTRAGNIFAEYLAAKFIHPPYTYDLTLFSALNAFYADKPINPAPREIEASSLFAQADKRVDYLLTLLPSFNGLQCLEVGCGRGETVVRLAERGNCAVTGVDIAQYAEWAERFGKRTKLLPLDITHDAPFPAQSFDFIYSFVVLEHVADPLAMLATMHRLLKPGGMLYFTANLYRGPLASHRYREVYFPWPHLLFADEVFSAYYRQEGYAFDGKPAWVNKLTRLHYSDYINRLGMKTLRCAYTKKLFDADFYTCFKDKLGKYPTEDLEIDFIKIQAVKPA